MPAVDALIGALKDADDNLRGTIYATLGDIGPLAKQAVGELTAGLKGRNRELKLRATVALGKIGSPSAATLDALMANLRSFGDEQLMNATGRALAAVGGGSERIAQALDFGGSGRSRD